MGALRVLLVCCAVLGLAHGLGAPWWIGFPLATIVAFSAELTLRRVLPHAAEAPAAAVRNGAGEIESDLRRRALDRVVAIHRVVRAFAEALVDGDYPRAHSLLTEPLRRRVSCEDLDREIGSVLHRRAEAGPGSIRVFAREDWLSMRSWEEWRAMRSTLARYSAAEFGVPVVSHWCAGLYGEGPARCVTVTVAVLDDGCRISNIEWGRP